MFGVFHSVKWIFSVIGRPEKKISLAFSLCIICKWTRQKRPHLGWEHLLLLQGKEKKVLCTWQTWDFESHKKTSSDVKEHLLVLQYNFWDLSLFPSRHGFNNNTTQLCYLSKKLIFSSFFGGEQNATTIIFSMTWVCKWLKAWICTCLLSSISVLFGFLFHIYIAGPPGAKWLSIG